MWVSRNRAVACVTHTIVRQLERAFRINMAAQMPPSTSPNSREVVRSAMVI
jgi:hypothetical protein